MLNTPGYTVTDQLHLGSRAVIFRARRDEDGVSVVLKAPRTARPTAAETVRLQAEYSLGQMVDHPAVVRYLARAQDGHRLVLVVEDIGGGALSGQLEQGPLPLERFLDVALEVAEGLAAIHQQGIIHRDINPSNIILDPASGKAKIIDLGIATLVTQSRESEAPPQQLEGTLRYISPEQTGRMNRSVDHRTDLYSLGVTLHEMLTGEILFAAQDPLELVHAHLARTPPSLTQVVDGLPEPVAAIVARLLAKNPGERYQSAHGLAADLRRCRDALARGGAVDDFPLGQEDVSARFTLPEKLYGREAEHEQLLAAFERARDGGRILLSVTGPSGSGKTALLRDLQRPVDERGGWFVRGQFDSQRQDTPRSAIIAVGAELVRRVLTGSEERVAAWRQRLLDALGEAGQVLIDVMPEVELLIGPQPAAPKLSGAEAEVRFNRLACAFFRLFARRRHPLVLQLDDLQWADPASLTLVELLMAEPQLHHLLLVGCYRSEDLTPSHPLSLTLAAVEGGPAETERIELGTLTTEQLSSLLADTLSAGVEAVSPLAALLHEKTLGNPLFVTQVLRTLHIDGLVTFDAGARAWRWDAERIAAREISDDVAELLLARMNGLPEATREVVELAACVGRRFKLGTLAALAERPLAHVAKATIPAVEEGVLRPCCSGFGLMVSSLPDDDGVGALLTDAPIQVEFVHSRFQQAAYTRIRAARKQELHLRLGRMLRGALGEDELQDRVFEVVHHFEAGIRGLEDPDERLEVARLCLAAGEKAVGAVAYTTAIHHFKAGVALLPCDRWEAHHLLTFELMEQLFFVQAMIRVTDDEVTALGEALLSHARTLTERLRVAASYVVHLSMQRRVEEALAHGASIFAELGLELLPDDIPRAIQEGRAEVDRLLGDRDPSALVDLPLMTDPEKLAAQRLVGSMYMPIYMRHRELVPMLSLANIRLALEHGNAPGSSMAFCAWGKILAFELGDIGRGYEFARVGRRLADDMGVFRAGTRLLSLGVEWLREPLREVLDRMRKTFRLGIETGEANFSAIISAMIPSIGFCAGVPLEALRQEIPTYVEVISANQGDVGVREYELTTRLIDTLLGRRALDAAMFASDEEAGRALEVMRVRNQEAVVWYHLQRARLSLLFGDPREALAHAALAAPHVDWGMGAFASFDLDFVHALALARCLDAPADDAEELLRELERHGQRLQGWIDAGAGVNLRHKALLIEAEICRVRGESAEIGTAYERAIEAAAASDQVQDQALANELAARHYTGAGLPKIARVYLQEAYYCYQKWGATARQKAMEKEHPFLAHAVAVPAGATTTYASSGTVQTTTGDQAPALDYATVLEASRAISGEVVLGSLLSRLLAIAAENAGAERAFLLLRQGAATRVAAAWDSSDDDVRLLEETPLSGFEELSAGVANYVTRTKDAVVLGEACREGRFQSDPHITRRQTRSLLCAPMLNQGRLVGLLYLENNLVSGAFTAARLELVNLLCSQAAVSIDNASLYAGLEQKVEERTRDLARKNEQLAESLEQQRQMQNQLLISEKMASLGNLVAGVAHELNTPIGAVVASVDTAEKAVNKLRGLLDEAGSLQDVMGGRRVPRMFTVLQDSHQVISVAGERVSEIVRTLRNFARLDEAERKPADLHEGIESTLDLLHHRLKHGVEVIREYGELPEVLCYPNQLNQVFMNLLVNAVDAVALPGELAASSGTIRIRTWLADEAAHVAISDDGPGIPVDARARIFDPGYTTKGVGVGTGLGLSICFSIVNKHDGEISVDSAPGAGSTFTVSVPTRTPAG